MAVSEEIISAVATTKGTDPTELEALYESIDPDALDTLYDRPGDGRGRTSLRVEFTYCGCEVSVARDGSVTVSEGPETEL